jgi:hypothetical protein
LRGQKRKATMMEQIAEVTNAERHTRTKIAALNATAKTNTAIKKEAIKHKVMIDMEVNCQAHQTREAAAMRTHEIFMIDRQIALEVARAGNNGGPSGYNGAPPGYNGGPVGGYPPFGINPNLC